MKILVVQTNTNSMLIPLPIGAAMVAEHLRRDGHEVRFLDLMGERDPVRVSQQTASEFKPDVFCFSIRNRDNQSMQDYADPMPGIRSVVYAVRKAVSVPIILGGTAFTTFPSRTLRYMNAGYGIAGDALEPISRFIHSLETGTPDLTTPGLVYRGSDGEVVENPFTITGYNNIGINYHEFIEAKRYRKCFWEAAIVTRTGCPEHCAYCDTYKTYGSTFVLRDPKEIAMEMKFRKSSGRVRSAWLVDAGFNRPLDHAKEILREIIKIGAQLRLYAVFDPGPADREFFQLFRRAGGVGVTIFAESLSDRILEALGKSFSTTEVFRDVQMMQEEGIGFMFMPTMGSPGETPETIDETLRRTPKLRSPFVYFNTGWRIMPGTPLQRRAIDEGLIAADDDCWEPHFYISPRTPVDLIEKKLRTFKWKHPLRYVRAIPFAASNLFYRPWTWGPGTV